MIKATPTQIANGRGIDAKSILQPVLRNTSQVRFHLDERRTGMVLRAVDAYGGVGQIKYVKTRHDRVYVDYREEWRVSDSDATLSAVYIHIAVAQVGQMSASSSNLVGLHFQPSVDLPQNHGDNANLSEDQVRWIRGPHFHLLTDDSLSKCHFFLGDDSRRRRNTWGAASVAKQLRAHLVMAVDQIVKYAIENY